MTRSVATGLAVLSAGVLCSAPAGTAPVPEGARLTEYRFPTEAGTKWVYKSKAGAEWQAVTTDVSDKACVKTVTVNYAEHPKRENAVAYFYCRGHRYVVSTDGLFEVASENRFGQFGFIWYEYDSPRCILKQPLRLGMRWTDRNDPDEAATFTVEKLERVRVTAGVYDAIRINRKGGGPPDEPEEVTRWYVSEIGLVREDVERGDKQGSFELVSFTPDTK